MSLILPALSQIISSDFASPATDSGYFAKVMATFHRVIEGFEHKELLSMAILFFMMTINGMLGITILYLNSGLTAKITTDCRKRVYSAVQKMPLSDLSKYSHGSFIQLIITETRSIYAIFKQMLNLIAGIINISVIVFLMMLLSLKLFIVLITGFIFVLWINLIITRSIKKLGKKALECRSKLATQVTEGIWGIKQLRLIQAESVMRKKINKTSLRSENIARVLRIRTGMLPFISKNFLILGVLAVIVVWLYYPVFPEGVPRTAGIITFLILVAKLFPYIGTISREYGTIFSNLPAIGRLQEYLGNECEQEQDGTMQMKPFFKNSVTLEDIHFGYSADKPVLSGITLKTKKGSYIGIKGPSGGGKSTLFNLLLRLYEPTRGKILIDDINIREFRLSHVRSNIGMVSQDMFLFNTSIRENLLLAKPDATEGNMRSALEKAGLLGFVESQDEGLDTLVGNNGDKLSGGQRQRLALAILFLRNPQIIILDEGTSSVDKETEKHILQSLRQLHKQGKTIICSSHKENTLIDAEYVYELKDGLLSQIQ